MNRVESHHHVHHLFNELAFIRLNVRPSAKLPGQRIAGGTRQFVDPAKFRPPPRPTLAGTRSADDQLHRFPGLTGTMTELANGAHRLPPCQSARRQRHDTRPVVTVSKLPTWNKPQHADFLSASSHLAGRICADARTTGNRVVQDWTRPGWIWSARTPIQAFAWRSFRLAYRCGTARTRRTESRPRFRREATYQQGNSYRLYFSANSATFPTRSAHASSPKGLRRRPPRSQFAIVASVFSHAERPVGADRYRPPAACIMLGFN